MDSTLADKIKVTLIDPDVDHIDVAIGDKKVTLKKTGDTSSENASWTIDDKNGLELSIAAVDKSSDSSSAVTGIEISLPQDKEKYEALDGKNVTAKQVDKNGNESTSEGKILTTVNRTPVEQTPNLSLDNKSKTLKVTDIDKNADKIVINAKEKEGTPLATLTKDSRGNWISDNENITVTKTSDGITIGPKKDHEKGYEDLLSGDAKQTVSVNVSNSKADDPVDVGKTSNEVEVDIKIEEKAKIKALEQAKKGAKDAINKMANLNDAQKEVFNINVEQAKILKDINDNIKAAEALNKVMWEIGGSKAEAKNN